MTIDAKDALGCFANLAALHQQHLLQPLWGAYPAAGNHPWLALKIFLKGYAFERQGRSEDYAWAAAETVDDYSNRQPDFMFSPEFAHLFWSDVAGKLGNESLNHKNNPCCPKGVRFEVETTDKKKVTIEGVEYNAKSKAKRKVFQTTNKKSVIEFLDNVRALDIVQWTQAKLQDGPTGIRAAHAALCTMNGVGSKVASLFLRDVSIIRNCLPTVQDARELLQPVDVWVLFVVRYLASNQTMSKEQCAAYLVEQNSIPEFVNMGIWCFCARVCESSQYRVRNALQDISSMRASIRTHLQNMKRDGELAQSHITHWARPVDLQATSS